MYFFSVLFFNGTVKLITKNVKANFQNTENTYGISPCKRCLNFTVSDQSLSYIRSICRRPL